MENNINIREMITKEDLIESFKVMGTLRTHLTLDQFLGLVEIMKPTGYRIFALFHNGEIASVAGVGIETNLYYLKNVFVFDLVTLESKRSLGLGEKIMTFLEDFARQNGCQSICLDSGVQRVDAHRFYEDKMDFKRVSYSFKKDL